MTKKTGEEAAKTGATLEPAPGASAERAAHWQRVYQDKSETQVSWFEESPALSLQLIAAAGFGPVKADTDAVDIGGGGARLVDALLRDGYRSVTVLDISAAALAVAQRRLQADADLRQLADRVTWVSADVTRWRPERQYDLWHDRAALHFLTDPADQAAYRATLLAALRPGGVAIIGTFAPDGPERCSNLPVQRYDAASLARLLGADFTLLTSCRHDHATPRGSVQHFQFSSFRRRR
ncbi:MAG TPA: class I SAM-dependent methyltransferase [Terriglobia bacterium]|nr:class I SAM-dependent methyltransferase [Terriglobia bacterium]